MRINLKKEFAEDYISRDAGEKLRNQILEIAKTGEKAVLDFSGLVIASTSFFDESIAKLAQAGWDDEALTCRIGLLSIHPRDKDLLISLCKKRGFKNPFGKGT